MSNKLFDLTVKTGEYPDGNGGTKGRYTKLGVVMQGDDGGMFALLEPTADIAGCLVLQNILAVSKGQPTRTTVMAGMFAENQQQGQQQGQQPQQNQQQGGFQQQSQPMNQQQNNFQQQQYQPNQG